MILTELIEEYVSGDWGNEELSDDTPNAVFCIRAADFVPILSVDYANIPTRYISDNSFENKLLKVGDIVIEKSGGSPTQSTGRVIIVTEELLKEKEHIVCSNFCEGFRVKEGWNPFYVFSYLQFLYNEGVFFNFEGKTSGLKNLQMEQAFSSIDIPEQKSDISILASIDEKIALNRKINVELEALAKEIYDYWFVQFDFPNEEGKPYKSSGGKMVWNETLKREIPEEWLTKSLNDISISYRGVTYSPSDLVDKERGVLVLRGNNIENNHVVYDSNVAYIPLEMVSSEQKIRQYDVIMTMSSGSKLHLGKCAMFFKESPHTYGAFLCKFTPNKECPFYFFGCATTAYFRKKIQAVNGTGINNLSNSIIDSIQFPYPKDSLIIEKYENEVSPYYNIIGNNIDQIEELTSLRAKLLPLLMNGQVTIKD